MIALSKRHSGQGPGLSPDGSGAPEFKVHFSRPAQSANRPELESNSFRWAGTGALHIFERGVLVVAKRRFPLGFRTLDERFVPASEIADVYREGNAVRVDILGAPRRREFFQFWTPDAVTAGTIVRLLPTTRTIEYEGTPADPSGAQPSPPPTRPDRSVRVIWAAALLVGLIVIAALAPTNMALHWNKPGERDQMTPLSIESKTTATRDYKTLHHATQVEFAGALADIHRFDDRIDALRTECRTAFLALQTGDLPQQDFIDGINRWLIPQWRALYKELAANPPAAGSLDSSVRQRLIDTVLDWEGGLGDYAAGLRDGSYTTVIAAFDRMSAGNEAQRQAWRILDRAESELSNPTVTAAPIRH
jgi:hypothetical protein